MDGKRKVGEYSEFTYEELMEKCKGKTKLKNTLNKIFDKYNDVIVTTRDGKFDVEDGGEFAYQYPDLIDDEHDSDDGWYAEDLEPLFAERYGDFDWDFNSISDTECIFVTDESDYINISIYKKLNLEDGVLDMLFFVNVHID